MGYDNSDMDPFEIEFRSEYRDNRGLREPFVNDDDEYFSVPEVLDEP
jgi:hypothetical protein